MQRLLAAHAYPANFDYMSRLIPYPTISHISRGGHDVTRYTFQVPDRVLQLFIAERTDELQNLCTHVLRFVRFKEPNRLYRFVFGRGGAHDILRLQSNALISTPFLRNPMQYMSQELRLKAEIYQDDAFVGFHTLIVEVIDEPSDIRVRKGASRIIAYGDMILVSPKSRTNCLYTAVAIARGYTNQADLINNVQVQNQHGKDLKRRHGLVACTVQNIEDPKERRETARELEQSEQLWCTGMISILHHLAQKLNTRIHLLKNNFQVRQVFAPVPVNFATRDIRVQVRGEHMWAILCRKTVETLYPEFPLPEYNENPAFAERYGDGAINKPHSLIPKYETKASKGDIEYTCAVSGTTQNYHETRNELIAAWDIETHDDGEGNAVPYMAGLAWYHIPIRMRQDIGGSKRWVTHITYTEGSEEFESARESGEAFCYKYRYWVGHDCLFKFLNFLLVNLETTFDGYTFYAHNGAKFDHHLLVQQIFQRTQQQSESNEGQEYQPPYGLKISDQNFIVQDGALTAFMLEGVGNKERVGRCMYFRDSFRLMSSSLDRLTKEFNVQHQKLTETVNHDMINAETYLDHLPELSKYLEHDCMGLLEVMQSFSEMVWNAMSINITSCFTAASLAKRNFLMNHYDPEQYPIYSLSEPFDAYIRQSYFGGRNECGFLGDSEKLSRFLDLPPEKSKIRYYDFTSLYPAMGVLDLPYGKPETMSGEEAIATLFNEECTKLKVSSDQFFGFIECEVTGPHNFDPDTQMTVHSTIQDNKLVFPVFQQPRRLVLCSEEIRYATEDAGLAYHYKPLSAMKFQKGPVMKELCEKAFRLKAEEAKAGHKAISNMWKIVVNSSYGFWGLRANDRDTVTIGPDNGERRNMLNTKLANGRIKTWANYADQYLLVRSIDDLPVEEYNVGIASYFTSYARCRLHKLCQALKKKGHLFLYCDTDSVITNGCIENDPELMKEFMWDGTGEALGSLTNEARELVEKELKGNQDLVAQEEIHDGGGLAFDRLIVTGCKSYCLVRKPTPLVPVEIFKSALKGMRKNAPIAQYTERYRYDAQGSMVSNWVTYPGKGKPISLEHFEIMDRGGAIVQNQMQFRSGSARLIDEARAGGVQKVYMDKAAKMAYTKGESYPDGSNRYGPLYLTHVDTERQNQFNPVWAQKINILNVTFASDIESVDSTVTNGKTRKRRSWGSNYYAKKRRI